jgi:hypothetical protein
MISLGPRPSASGALLMPEGWEILACGMKDGGPDA